MAVGALIFFFSVCTVYEKIPYQCLASIESNIASVHEVKGSKPGRINQCTFLSDGNLHVLTCVSMRTQLHFEITQYSYFRLYLRNL